MPKAPRWFVRAALLHLVAGVTMGALMLLSNHGLLEGFPDLRSSHVQTLVFGFFAQFALGVALWILPKNREKQPVGSRADWLAWALLNAGVLGFILVSLDPVRVAAQVCVAIAILILISRILPRVRSAKAIANGSQG